MKSFNILVISVLLLAIIPSCTIEKRLHRPGFYVETQSHRESKKQHEFTSTSNVNYQKNQPIAVQKENQNLTSIDTKVKNFFEPENSTKAILLAQNHTSTHSQLEQAVSISLKQRVASIVSENKKAWEIYQAKALARGNKNQIVAILLCFFLGFLGIHSFYLGNKQKGIIQLAMFLVGLFTFLFIIGYLILTALGIWVLIDFIRLIIGDLGPGW